MNQLPQILRTARAGSPARAWRMFEEGGWLDAVDDPKALTLKGRLLKDEAKAASGKEQLRLYAEAGEAYRAAAEHVPASYPLINAATLAFRSSIMAVYISATVPRPFDISASMAARLLTPILR